VRIRNRVLFPLTNPYNSLKPESPTPGISFDATPSWKHPRGIEVEKRFTFRRKRMGRFGSKRVTIQESFRRPLFVVVG